MARNLVHRFGPTRITANGVGFQSKRSLIWKNKQMFVHVALVSAVLKSTNLLSFHFPCLDQEAGVLNESNSTNDHQ